MHPDLLARLTDWQIAEIYARKRDGKGGLAPPNKKAAKADGKPLSLEQELALAAGMMANLGVSADEQEKGFEKIKQAHAGKNGG